MTTSFKACEICGERDWTEIYVGPVRDGPFGSLAKGGTVARCGGCGADRLSEASCAPPEIYESDAYREKLQQGLDTRAYFAEHDRLQIHTLLALWPRALHGATVADIGCAGGSFLDHVAGLAARLIAVDPSPVYRKSLLERDYEVFPYTDDAVKACRQVVDLAVSIQVIEHTVDPRAFLADIRPLIAPGGSLLISTPNRDDILMELLPQEYPSFFYRVVHRWYFDARSLATCASLAGYVVERTRHLHRYSLSNAMAWLRDRRPTGDSRIAGIEPLADDLWRSYLESTGRSDCLYMILRPTDGQLPV